MYVYICIYIADVCWRMLTYVGVCLCVALQWLQSTIVADVYLATGVGYICIYIYIHTHTHTQLTYLITGVGCIRQRCTIIGSKQEFLVHTQRRKFSHCKILSNSYRTHTQKKTLAETADYCVCPQTRIQQLLQLLCSELGTKSVVNQVFPTIRRVCANFCAVDSSLTIRVSSFVKASYTSSLRPQYTSRLRLHKLAF